MIVTALPGSTVRAKFTLEHRCPYKHEHDSGTVEITWKTHTHTLELHALGKWLSEFSDVVISHEDLTQQIEEHLRYLAPRLRVLSVVTEWTTAGASVQVTR